MLIILQDAARRPELFDWFGAIPKPEIEEWVSHAQLVLPLDLIELWEATGGGDIFESETILRPTVPSKPNSGFLADDIESGNVRHAEAGKPHRLCVFQQGVFLSAVRLQDQKFVTLERDYAVKSLFHSLDEWYVGTLRAEFGQRYGLNSELL